MKKLIIMGGVTGSGKSTTARKILEESGVTGVIYSTDDYWNTPSGEYNFIPSMIGTAHAWNTRRVEAALETDVELVIVDNTNTTEWERAPFVKLAEKYGYEVEYRQADSPWWGDIYSRIKSGEISEADVDVLVEKNTHGVPRDTIKKMMNRYNFPE